MQLKYLNFYRLLSRIATNIVGAFIALIIYDKTGSLFYAFGFITLEALLFYAFDFAFKKWYFKYPQIFLVLRILPFTIYILSIFLIDYNLLLGVSIACVFNALSDSFNQLPGDAIYNYSKKEENDSGKSYSVTRFMEQAGKIIAFIAGGLFLDYIGVWIVIVLSISIYLISVIPLLIYYFKERRNPIFNQEAVSNAIEEFKEIKIKRMQKHKITARLTAGYGLLYFLFCGVDVFSTSLVILMFAKGAASYAMAGYVSAVLTASFGIGYLVVSRLYKKHDITKLCVISGIAIAAIVCICPFIIEYPIIILVLMAIMGFCNSSMSLFAMIQMLSRSQVLGASNKALLSREYGVVLGYGTPALGAVCASGIQFLARGAITPLSIIPCFFIMAAMMLGYSIALPFVEENNRRRMVDYLENNKLY